MIIPFLIISFILLMVFLYGITKKRNLGVLSRSVPIPPLLPHSDKTWEESTDTLDPLPPEHETLKHRIIPHLESIFQLPLSDYYKSKNIAALDLEFHGIKNHPHFCNSFQNTIRQYLSDYPWIQSKYPNYFDYVIEKYSCS